ncbi:hypothetical protein D3C81_896250 [compost metagenome]
MAIVADIVAGDGQGLEVVGGGGDEGDGAGMVQRTDAGTGTHVPLAAAVHRQLRDLVARIVAQRAVEHGAVAQRHLHVGGGAVDHDIASQAAVVGSEQNVCGGDRASVGEHRVTHPQQAATVEVALLARDDIGVVERQLVVAALQPQRGAVLGLQGAVVEHQTVPVRPEHGDVGAIGTRIRALPMDAQVVGGELGRVHLHDAERGCTQCGYRASVQLRIGRAAAKEDAATAGAMGGDVQVLGADARVGRRRIAARGTQAVDTIAVAIDAAAGDRGSTTPDVHAMAVAVVAIGAERGIGEVGQRVRAGQPDAGIAVAHGEVGTVGGQLGPAVDVDAVAADGLETAAGDIGGGVHAVATVAEQADAAAAAAGTATHDLQRATVVDVEVAVDHVHVAQRQHAAAAAGGQTAAVAAAGFVEGHLQRFQRQQRATLGVHCAVGTVVDLRTGHVQFAATSSGVQSVPAATDTATVQPHLAATGGIDRAVAGAIAEGIDDQVVGADHAARTAGVQRIADGGAAAAAADLQDAALEQDAATGAGKDAAAAAGARDPAAIDRNGAAHTVGLQRVAACTVLQGVVGAQLQAATIGNLQRPLQFGRMHGQGGPQGAGQQAGNQGKARHARAGGRTAAPWGRGVHAVGFLWQGAARLRDLTRQGRVAVETACDGRCRRHPVSLPPVTR